MKTDSLTEQVQKQAEWLSTPLTAAAAEKITQFVLFLDEYNKNVNLVGAKTVQEIIEKHVLDALSLVKEVRELDLYRPAGVLSYADIGSGGGLPAFITALALAFDHPDNRIKLLMVDSIAKKCRFLEEARAHLNLVTPTPGNLEIRVESCRAEDLSHAPDLREKFDFASARAVGTLKLTSELVVPFIKKGGYYLVQKTEQRYQQELKESQKIRQNVGLTLDPVKFTTYEQFAPIGQNVLLSFKKERATPPAYPRLWKKIMEENRG